MPAWHRRQWASALGMLGKWAWLTRCDVLNVKMLPGRKVSAVGSPSQATECKTLMNFSESENLYSVWQVSYTNWMRTRPSQLPKQACWLLVLVVLFACMHDAAKWQGATSEFWPSAQNIEMYCLPPVHHHCDHCVMLTSWSVERVIQTKDYRSDVVVVASIIFDQTLRKSLCRLISAYCFHHLLPPNSRKISVLRSQQIY